MATIRKQQKHGNTRWVCDYYDATGTRRQKFFPTKERAEDHLAEAIQASRQKRTPDIDTDVMFGPYAQTWLAGLQVKPRSRDTYAQQVRLYLEPAFGGVRLRDLRRRALRAFLERQLKTLSRSTVRLTYATLRAILARGVDDELLAANPALGLGGSLHLSKSTTDRGEAVKAFTRPQRDRFFTMARTLAPLWARVWTVQHLAGLRPGEAFGLRDADVDLGAALLTVAGTLSDDGRERQDSTKTNRTRTVDLTPQVLATVREQWVWKKKQTLAAGWGEVPALLFVSPSTGSFLRPIDGRRAFRRVLRALHEQDVQNGVPVADRFPLHFHPHCLRHSFASLHLQAGADIYYIARQLGHAKIAETADTYAKWLPVNRRGALDQLDMDTATGGAGR